ncbi:MAG: hypothetical protein GKS03_17025 [Alphaproteobacteria bacterium]|nr:hypothetical protein [Alphaproteobacteria bacterium]
MTTTAKYTARFTTAGRLTSIEKWLKQNMKGNWSFKLESVSDDMSKKSYALMFDDAIDCNAFKMRFTPAKPVDPTQSGKMQGRLSSKTMDLLGSVAALPVRTWVALGRPFYRG